MTSKLSQSVLFLFFLAATAVWAQQLPAKWEKLTAEDFVKALSQSSNVCVSPFGIIEKHEPSGPLGTDLINVRAATMHPVGKQYAVVFPEYYFGQVTETRHQPGTVSYRAEPSVDTLSGYD